MKTVKQWLYIIIAFVMVISMASCASDTPSSSSTGSSAGSSTGSSTTGTVSSEPAAPEQKDYSERLTVSIGTSGVIEGYSYTDGDPLCKYWSDMFNWDVSMVAIPSDQVAEMTRIWISSRDMPDIMIYDYGTTRHPDFTSYVEQELLFKLPDDWKEKWPNAAKVFDTTGVGPVLEEMFGGVYCLPRARFAERLPGNIAIPLANHMGIHMRADWIKAVGMELKYEIK